MKLNKNNWKRKPFSFVADCIEKHDKNAINNGLTKFIGLENLDGSSLSINGAGEIENGTTFSKTFQSGDVLFGKRRPYLRKVAIADFNGICSGDILVFRAKEKSIHPELLPLYVTSENFIQYAISTSAGSLSPRTKWRDLANYEIPLPSLEEQKQIAALFQSIETAMEQVEAQVQHLKALQKSLVNGLLSKEPVFGNLLNSNNCTATVFGDIAECDKKYPEHEKEVERFVGLEWIEADNFQLQGFGLVANGTTFTKRFIKGDVLFGKRRAYLKKVAVADFDGICSGDILVIRAKAKKMLQGLLPYYISADAFIQHAVSTSAGSLSPRTKWKDLAELEVSIPDIKTQTTILEVLQQLDNTVNQLKQQRTTLKHLKQKLLNEILG
ncbi:MAG: restriction endonuclease subunit S [Bacteroidales bacterium]|nr:restriction endonuclease subunit S [Bacteroidales bacterium]